MFVFEDEKNYKPCKLKQYDAYVCMPPKGTIVINKLESLGGINVGKEYFTPEEQLKFNDSQKNMISSLINNSNALHFVSDKEPFVLAGTCGELSVISPSELAQNYNFLQSNQPVGINQQNLNQRMTGEYLKWTLVRLKPSMVNYMACRVPTSIRTNIQTKFGVGSINHQGVSHGKGDFVVCNKLPNGKPNFSTRFVVNGNVFASTFNNQGWQDSIRDTKTFNISNLPNLVPSDVVAEKPIDAKSFRDKCDTLMKELQKIYKFTVSSNNYELVKDYRGIAKEVTFKGDTYVAKFTVSGNFSHTYHGKNGDNEVKVNETSIYFGCSTHQDSALYMSINPKTIDNVYLSGWTFPSKGSESRSDYDYPKSKTGGISSINCAEEAKYFLNNNKGADYFIDNRGTDKNKDEEDNGEPIDAKAFREKCDTLMKELQKVFKFKVISNNYEVVDNYTGLAHEFKFDGKTYVAKYMISGEFTHTPSSGNEFKVDKTAVWFGCSAHHRDSALTISMHPDIDKLYLSGWVFPHKRSKCMTGDLYPHCTSGTILTMNCAEEVQMFVDGCKCCDYIDNRDAYNDTLVTIRDTVENRLKSGKYLPLSKDKSCDVTLKDGILHFDNTYIKYHDSKKNELDLVLRVGQNLEGLYKTVSKSNKKEIYDFIETFNNFRKRGYESSFRTPSCDVNTFESIIEYSMSGYVVMGTSLETNNFTEMDIDMYLKTVNLHSYLSRCRTRGITLFRGVYGFRDLNVGDRIPCNRFTSLTLNLRIASNFGDTIFIFEDVDIEGAYINSFSEYRDSEFEVLMNAGYDIVVKKIIGEGYYLCSLVKNNYKLNKADNFDDLEVLVMSALSSSKVILDTYSISSSCSEKGYFSFSLRETLGRNRISLGINFTKKGISKVIVDTSNPKVESNKVFNLIDLKSSDLVGINSNDLVYNTIIPAIEKYTLEKCKGVGEPNNTFKYLSLLFYGVTLAFQREGYVILNSVFDKYDSWDKKDTYDGKLTINGDNDDKLVLSLKLDSENNFTISARSNNKKANKSVKFDGSDIDGLCNNVYNLVVKTFNLSQFNRVEKAVNLASKYLDCDNSLIQSQETSQLYKIGDKELLISVSFGKINLGGRLELNYFDNLRTIASGIINIVKE